MTASYVQTLRQSFKSKVVLRKQDTKEYMLYVDNQLEQFRNA